MLVFFWIFCPSRTFTCWGYVQFFDICSVYLYPSINITRINNFCYQTVAEFFNLLCKSSTNNFCFPISAKLCFQTHQQINHLFFSITITIVSANSTIQNLLFMVSLLRRSVTQQILTHIKWLCVRHIAALAYTTEQRRHLSVWIKLY